MKKIFTLLLCHVFCLAFGQKKEYYVNDDFVYITKAVFETKPDHELGYTMKFESDTATTYLKVSRYKKGQISRSLFDSIKAKLSINELENIDKGDALFINYYPDNDKCSSRNYKENFRKKHKKYYRDIEKMKNVKQVFVYKSTDGLNDFGSLIKWKSDVSNLIENTFYPVNYPCGGYVILKSDGSYISQRGEYCYSESLIENIKIFIDEK